MQPVGEGSGSLRQRLPIGGRHLKAVRSGWSLTFYPQPPRGLQQGGGTAALIYLRLPHPTITPNVILSTKGSRYAALSFTSPFYPPQGEATPPVPQRRVTLKLRPLSKPPPWLRARRRLPQKPRKNQNESESLARLYLMRS